MLERWKVLSMRWIDLRFPTYAVLLLALLLTGCATPWHTEQAVTATPTPQFAGGEPVLPQLQRLYHDAPPLISSITTSDTSWPLAGHDAANTSATIASRITGTTHWFFQTNGPVIASPVVAGNLVLLNGGDGVLYALNKHTSVMQWRTPLGDTLVAGTAAIAGGVVYVAAQEHGLRALRLDTGTALWSVDTKLPVRAAPLVVGSLLFVLAGANSLLCLDAQHGAEYWEFKSEDVLTNYWPTQGQPAVATRDGGLIFTALGAATEFNALNVRTGRKIWEQTVDSRMVGSPVYDAQLGVVFVATWAGHIYAMDAQTGEVRWRFALAHTGTVGVGFATGPALANGTVFVGDYQGHVLAVDAHTGQVRWTYQGTSAVVGTPVVRLTQQGTSDVYVAGQDGTLFALNDETGIQEWHIYLGELRSAPALSQDTLFIGSVGDRGLFALV